MNVKTLILGVVMGGMIAAGTYFFLPTPTGASAQGNCATSWELDSAVALLTLEIQMAESSIQSHVSSEVMIWSD